MKSLASAIGALFGTTVRNQLNESTVPAPLVERTLKAVLAKYDDEPSRFFPVEDGGMIAAGETHATFISESGAVQTKLLSEDYLTECAKCGGTCGGAPMNTMMSIGGGTSSGAGNHAHEHEEETDEDAQVEDIKEFVNLAVSPKITQEHIQQATDYDTAVEAGDARAIGAAARQLISAVGIKDEEIASLAEALMGPRRTDRKKLGRMMTKGLSRHRKIGESIDPDAFENTDPELQVWIHENLIPNVSDPTGLAERYDAALRAGDYDAAIEIVDSAVREAGDKIGEEQLDEYKRMGTTMRAALIRSRRIQTPGEKKLNKLRRLNYKRSSSVRRSRQVYYKKNRRNILRARSMMKEDAFSDGDTVMTFTGPAHVIRELAEAADEAGIDVEYYGNSMVVPFAEGEVLVRIAGGELDKDDEAFAALDEASKKKVKQKSSDSQEPKGPACKASK